ncbi:MAG: hypothetical protein LUD17_12360 [Bacteroidales bacterium]|nr:hypothetical protein [Bacteroidales bacterium]
MIPVKIDKILDYCDGPQIFTVRDPFDTLYLSLASPKENEYLTIPISLSKLTSFENGLIDLRSVFLNPEKGKEYFILNTTSENFEMRPIRASEISEEWLPDEGFYLSPEEKETVTITLPRADHSLLRSIVKRFGWVAM